MFVVTRPVCYMEVEGMREEEKCKYVDDALEVAAQMGLIVDTGQRRNGQIVYTKTKKGEDPKEWERWRASQLARLEGKPAM